jgi:hypothetical protein
MRRDLRSCLHEAKVLREKIQFHAAIPMASVELPGRTDGAWTIPERRVLSGSLREAHVYCVRNQIL